MIWHCASTRKVLIVKILFIEDDLRTARFVTKGLEEAGFVVDHVTDGVTGLHMALTESYEVAVVDIMLPGMDGLTLIDKVRDSKMTTPVIVLSAKNTVDDRVKGLQAGGDDYLVKPFSFSELLARIQALIRRSRLTPEPTTISVGDLTVDLVRRRVFCGNEEVHLQSKEFTLLVYLIKNRGRVVSKTMIMENVWDYNFDPQTNIVESRICRLREKIDRVCHKKLIHTIRGAGYVLDGKE